MKKLPHLIVNALTAIILISPALICPVAEATTAAPPKTPPTAAKHHASGLVTQRLVEGTGAEHPDGNDFVIVHFELWSPDGEKFQSSYDHGKPGEFPLGKIFPAWSEGIQMMVEGEKRRLWIPAELAPPNPKSGPKGAVICDMELVSFRSVPNLPKGGTTPPPGTPSTSFGVYSVTLEKGKEEEVDTGIGAMANFTLWTQNGKMQDSTALRNRPTFFLYDRVMAPFGDILKQMAIGEKRRIWIPGNVANGQWVGSPKGMLIFELELIKFMDESVLAPPQSGDADVTVGGPKKSG